MRIIKPTILLISLFLPVVFIFMGLNYSRQIGPNGCPIEDCQITKSVGYPYGVYTKSYLVGLNCGEWEGDSDRDWCKPKYHLEPTHLLIDIFIYFTVSYVLITAGYLLISKINSNKKS